MSKIIVKSLLPRGFRRAGIHFTREGVELDTSKLKKDQLEAIQAEPNLVIDGDTVTIKAPPQVDMCYRVLKGFEHGGAQVKPTDDAGAPVFIQLTDEEAAKYAAAEVISTADGDVAFPPKAEKAGKGKKAN